MTAPARLAHVVLKTSRLPEMVDWYVLVLEGHPVFVNEMVGFMTYDDEHHRVGFIATGASESPEPKHTGVEHFAFTYNTLGELIGTYKRLKAEGIKPIWTINHGATVSMYYADPDGNHVELQIDVFPDTAATQAFIESDAYAQNPIGVEFDPEELTARFEAGEPVAELVKRP